MQAFRTRYGEPIVLTLNAYQQGSPGLITALEAICNTAEQNGEKRAKADMATSVCEHLHVGPSSGVKCLECHYAETGYARIAEVESEMEMVKQERKERGVPALDVHEPVQQESDELSDEDLRKALEGITD